MFIIVLESFEIRHSSNCYIITFYPPSSYPFFVSILLFVGLAPRAQRASWWICNPSRWLVQNCLISSLSGRDCNFSFYLLMISSFHLKLYEDLFFVLDFNSFGDHYVGVVLWSIGCKWRNRPDNLVTVYIRGKYSVHKHACLATDKTQITQNNWKTSLLYYYYFFGYIFLFCLLQVANLVLAAAETHRWYRRKFENYPTNRVAVIPFVY